jgi:hypothetical protein
MYGNCHEIRGQVSIDVGDVVGNSTLDVDVAFANAKPGDRLVVNPNQPLPAGLIASAPRVKSSGVITLTIANVTAGNVAGGNAVVFDVSLIKATGSI